MPSYRFSISAYSDGSSPLTFLINPLEVSGMVGDRPYTSIPVLNGSDFKQFSIQDTRKKSFSFDIIADENTAVRDFIFGTSENDANSLLYLTKLDSDGQLSLYYMNIPSELKLLRPRGYRETEWIPVRILDVVPSISGQGKIRWSVTLYYEIVPAAEITSSSSSSSSSSGSSGSSSSSSVGSSSSSSSSSESSSSSSSE